VATRVSTAADVAVRATRHEPARGRPEELAEQSPPGELQERAAGSLLEDRGSLLAHLSLSKALGSTQLDDALKGLVLDKDDPPAWVTNTTVATLAFVVGFNRQEKLKAAIIAGTAFIGVFAGTITSSVITTCDPDLVPKDFKQKATLSNVAQDISTPHGRLWTTFLVSAAIMLLVSMYPFQIYRCWAPWVTRDVNPFVHPSMQWRQERWFRTVWAVLPNMGFILTGAIPSLSGVQGYELVLTGVHNVCAPLSMLFCVLMETVQLHFGENAFLYFFSDEAANDIYGPLTNMQRIRAATVICAWTAGVIFVGVQAYLAFCKNERYWLALVSYYGEVCGLILAFAMPALASLEYLVGQEDGTVFEEVKRLIVHANPGR